MTLLLYIFFPLLCIVAIPPASGKGATAERLVFGIALYEFLLLTIGTVLGLTHLLTTQAYAAVTCCAALVLLVQSWRNGIRLDITPALRWLRTRRGAAALILAALLAFVFALQLGFDALYGTMHYDGLWYHIPRVIFWLQQGSFDAWPTPIWGHVGLPVGADAILGQNILLGNGWRGVGFVTCVLSVGAIACVYIAALDFRLSRWHAVMAAILFGSFPAIGLRIWAVNSDIAAAFPVLAAYVALHRVRNVKFSLAVFVLLNGVAVACKPTVAPHALLLGGFALWHCRLKISQLRSFALPIAAAALAAAVVISSYWPVYAAFSDFQGGEPGRDHKIGSVTEFARAVAMNAGHWLLEPLGYLTPFIKSSIIGMAETVYNALGANITELPESWKPWPAQDIGRSGLASILLIPALLYWLPLRARMQAALLFMLGFVSLSGMLHFTPFTARYTVVLLAGYALLWGGTRLFQRGNRRWVLVFIVGLNVCALLGVVSVRFYQDKVNPAERFNYISDQDRNFIASTLTGRPLLVITSDSLDALLVGPDIDFSLSYIICPASCDWGNELRNASVRSNWLAVVHHGQRSLRKDVEWDRPGFQSCSEISAQVVEEALALAGWRLYKHDKKVDLWRIE